MKRLLRGRARKLVLATAVICAAGGVAAIVLVSRADSGGDESLRAPLVLEGLPRATDPLTRELALEMMARTHAQIEARGELAELRAKYGEPVPASGPEEVECWEWKRQRIFFCADEVTGEGWSYQLPQPDG